MTTVIGINFNNSDNTGTLYLRDERGFKYRVRITEAHGLKDLYMCSGTPKMTEEIFNSLEEKMDIL